MDPLVSSAPSPAGLPDAPVQQGNMFAWYDQLANGLDTAFREHPEQAWAVVIGVVVVWVVLAWLLMRYFPGVRYAVVLVFKNFFGGGHRRKILEVLGDSEIPITILTEAEDGRKRFLCRTRFQYKKGEKLFLEVTNHRGLKQAMPGKEVLCHFRPIRHMHLRINGFKSYIVQRKKTKRGDIILAVRMPLSTGRYNCRFVKRIEVRDQRLVIAGVWTADPAAPSGKTFMASPPAFMVNDSRTAKIKGSDKVFDISVYGIRVGVLQDLLLSEVRKEMVADSPLCLELRMFNRDTKNFDRHYLAGTLRHIRRGARGMLIMGIEFTHTAEKKTTGGLPEFTWIRTEKSRPFRAYAEAVKRLRG